MKDALKFFQAYIKEMIDVGGNNLPKAISSKSEIKNYRNAIYNIHKLLDLLNPLFNVFEDQLDDIDLSFL
ncbi:MAG: hypothetical protein ACFE9S_18880 [Candidatus Hermodarchaeota archaeon]